MALDRTLFSPELVFLGWHCTTPNEVLSQLARKLEPRGYVAATWLDAVIDREHAYPTGLKTPTCSIAIPHTDAVHTLRPFVAVVRPIEPVRFEPMADLGDPVDAELIVSLGFTHEGDQVEALQRVMEVFADEDRARAVLAAPDPASMIDLLAG